ncbi:MAG: hypothetical protein WCL14_04325 [Bacteroidota bacterium]
MKKILLILLFACQQFMAMAQPSQYKVLSSTNISYNDVKNGNFDVQGNTNGNSTENSNLGISFQPGFFITEHFVLGLTTRYVDNKSTAEMLPSYRTTTDSKTWYYGIFGRSYTPITEKLFFINSFAFSERFGTNTSINYFLTQDSSITATLDVKGYFIAYTPGISYYIWNWLSINANIGSISYDHFTTTTSSGAGTGASSTTGTFAINFPFTNFNFGIDFLIGTKANK